MTIRLNTEPAARVNVINTKMNELIATNPTQPMGGFEGVLNVMQIDNGIHKKANDNTDWRPEKSASPDHEQYEQNAVVIDQPEQDETLVESNPGTSVISDERHPVSTPNEVLELISHPQTQTPLEPIQDDGLKALDLIPIVDAFKDWITNNPAVLPEDLDVESVTLFLDESQSVLPEVIALTSLLDAQPIQMLVDNPTDAAEMIVEEVVQLSTLIVPIQAVQMKQVSDAPLNTSKLQPQVNTPLNPNTPFILDVTADPDNEPSVSTLPRKTTPLSPIPVAGDDVLGTSVEEELPEQTLTKENQRRPGGSLFKNAAENPVRLDISSIQTVDANPIQADPKGITTNVPASAITIPAGEVGLQSIGREGLRTEVLQEMNKTPKTPVQKQLRPQFSRLLHVVQKMIENTRPPFDLKMLQQLEIKLSDPAGTINLDLLQDQGLLHIKAIVPNEALVDLRGMEQDLNQSLQDHGLSLGSFDMKSEDSPEEAENAMIEQESQSDPIESLQARIMRGSGILLNTKA